MTGLPESYRYFPVVSGDGKGGKGTEVRGDLGRRLGAVRVAVALVTPSMIIVVLIHVMTIVL